MTALALRGRTSTDPRDVNRATNSTRNGREACPEAVEWQARLASAGFRVRLRNVERALIEYRKLYDDAEGFLAYLLNYADPTGETATSRVLRAHVGGAR